MTEELPLHQRPGAARYERWNGAWTVRITGDVLDSLKEAVKGGGERTITVTKKDGTTKPQPVTGRAWPIANSRSRTACVYLMELPAQDQHGPQRPNPQPEREERCRQCDTVTPTWDLDWKLDEDGVGGMVCSRCASRDTWQRSYDD